VIITVETVVRARINAVWTAYSTPADIVQWNAASDDWHTTSSVVDLRPGGKFCSRMEAKDGSVGFDFEGTYTTVEVGRLIAYELGDRRVTVEFTDRPDGVSVRVSFDAEDLHSSEQQRAGWQAILDRFTAHVESTQGRVAG